MCGIGGFYNDRLTKEQIGIKASRMHNAMSHRGPDGHGYYMDSHKPLCLLHRRLAIIDPENGAQPMCSKDESLVIVFNGAIYNYLELRKELLSKGHPLSSYSDTEVLLYAYAEWGEACLSKLLGMFAFVIWDRKKLKIFCARDRIGIKPFYYSINNQFFIFASEIKAILAEGSVNASQNFDGIKDYLAFQFCLEDKTLFNNIKKLEPGHSLSINISENHLRWTLSRYWDVSYNIDYNHKEDWFLDNLKYLLEDSVRLHLRSDVPLGSHLSGGLDSSYVASLASRLLGDEKLSTFTGAFNRGPQYDETPYARLVADKIQSKHHEIFIPEQEFTQILPQLIYYMDEPVAGPGLIPQYYVSKKAAEHVKVVLGGQGGDEIFIGYARYLIATLERSIHNSIDNQGDSFTDVRLEDLAGNLMVLKNYKPLMRQFFNSGLFDTADKRAFALLDRSAETKNLMNQAIFSDDYQPVSTFSKMFNREGIDSYINKITYVDLKVSLPALLQVEDRTSMAASIESRVPLLDHRIIEFMATIPPNIKFSGGMLKYLFKKITKEYLPKEIHERKDKLGFPTPINAWFNGFAKDFVFDTLLSSKARQRGFYNNELLEDSLSKNNEFSRSIWGILNLELWHQLFIDNQTTTINHDQQHKEPLASYHND